MRISFVHILVIILVKILSLHSEASMSLQKFQEKPQLVVLVVIDQFRSDYLTRFSDTFLPPKDKSGKIGGFKFLMSSGAYYPFAHYNLFQAMTCPGHATIMTGSYPSDTGISMNEWYDRDSGEMTYCVKDSEFGVSPRRLKTTTVSDELKNIDKKSKVVSLALKDRAAIMMGGQRADQVYWMDEKKLQWMTSSYYSNGVLSNWVKNSNEKLSSLAGKSYEWKELKRSVPMNDPKVMISPFGIETTIDLAMLALEKEKLGQIKGQTDFLLISLSSHDYVGHLYGPNSPEMASMTTIEDQQLSRFFNQIQSHVGLQSTVVVLTGDHGIPPASDYLKDKKIKSDRIDYIALFKRIYSKLDEKYGVPKNGPWIIAYKYFNFYLNPKVLAEKKLENSELSQEIKKILLTESGVSAVYTRDELLKGQIAPGTWATALVNQFVFANNGDIIFMPEPFYYEKTDAFVTHMTGYNYDTRVPLIISGAPFKAGVYTEYAQVIDLAPTLSFIMNIVSPPKARGRVLSEAIK